MRMTESRMCYVAYPIDLATDTAAKISTMVDAIITAMKGHVDVCYVPGDAFDVAANATPGAALGMINRYALDMADVVVAFLPSYAKSIGVPIEVENSVRQGKLTILITDHDTWMFQYPVTNFVRIDFDTTVVGTRNRLHQFMSDIVWEDYVAPIIKRGLDDDTFDGMRHDLNIKFLDPGDETPVGYQNPRLPEQAYPDDAGFDLYTTETVDIQPGEFVDIPFSVAMELPAGTWGMLTGRSSTLRNMDLLVTTGIIDAGYRGPLYAGVKNLSQSVRRVTAGSRIAQMILLPNITMQYQPVRVEELGESARGHQGFGSSGA